MTAGQLKATAKEHMERQEKTRYYTAEESVNKLLNDYAERAGMQQVWISIDGAGFRKNMLGREFCRLLELAFSQALETCVATTPPKKRYLKIRSMDAQNKVFVKILYSCEAPVMAGFDKRYHSMQDIVERVDGYMRIQFTEDENILKIAIPM